MSLIASLATQTHYLADGAQLVWDFSFEDGYLLPEFVKAYKRSPGGVRTELTINPATDLIGPFQLKIVPAVDAGYTLVIYRATERNSPLVDFAGGARISPTNLDTATRQGIHLAAESGDFFGTTTEQDLVALGQAAAASAAAAAASQTNAAASASAASTSASAAATSASSAAASAASAATSAANAQAAARIEMRSIKSFGALVGDGVADDAAVWLAAAAAGPGIIDARGVTSKCLSQINVQDGQTWLLAGAHLYMAGTTQKLFNAVSKKDFNIVGECLIEGDLTINPGESVSAAAVYVEDCRRFKVSGITGRVIQGAVVQSEPGGSAVIRSDHGSFENIRGAECVWGFRNTVAGAGNEYCTLINPHFNAMAGAGVELCSGNVTVLGGQLVDNWDNIRIRGGSNNAHGIVVGANINHAQNYTIHVKDVTNGHTFSACHVYGNGTAGQGPIFFENSKRVVITGSLLDCWVYNNGGANQGPNWLMNNHCTGDYLGVQLLGTNPEFIRSFGNYGRGATWTGTTMNTPGPVSANLARAAGSPSAALTSGVATLLQWPTTEVNGNRASLYVAGEFTIPAEEGGTYELEGNQLFTASTVTGNASFIEVQVSLASGGGYTSVDVFTPTVVFGTGSVTNFAHKSVLCNLQPGDKVRIMATITGTGTITHGRSTWRSWVQFKKTA